MCRVGVYQFILGLRRSEPVEPHFLVAVLLGVDALLRCVVRTVIKSLSVAGPVHSRKFHPLYAVGQQLFGRRVHDVDFDPVRTCRSQRIGEIASVLGERAGVHRHRAVVRQRVRVEEYLLLVAVERTFAVDYRLVLQSAVPGYVIPVAAFCRRTFGRVVPQLHEAVAYVVAGGQSGEIAERRFVLPPDPFGGAVGVVVFEPAVRVGDLRSEIVIDDIFAFRRRIFDFLF